MPCTWEMSVQVHLPSSQLLQFHCEPLDGSCICCWPLGCFVHLVDVQQRDLHASVTGITAALMRTTGGD